MKRRKKTLTKAVCAALFLGAVLSPVTPGAPLYAQAEEEEGEKALEYLSSAEKLIAADPALNQITIGLMLDKAEGALPAGHPAIFALEDIRTNLEQGMDSASLGILVEEARRQILDKSVGDAVLEQQETLGIEAAETEAAENEAAGNEAAKTEAPPEEVVLPEFDRKESGLPEYAEEAYLWKYLTESVGLQVPGDWGNNEAGREVTSYSPVNGSGAINVGAGTLQTTHYEDEEEAAAACDRYVDSIRKLSTTRQVSADDAVVNGIDGRRLTYTMAVGANLFDCEVFCFHYGENMYTIQLLQGNQSEFDYFPVFDNAVGSVRVGDPVVLPENPAAPEETAPEPETTAAPETASAQETTAAPETAPVQETTAAPETASAQETTAAPETAPIQETTPAQETAPVQETTPAPETVPVPETAPAPENAPTADLGSFTYAIEGQNYHFPTEVKDLAQNALPIDRSEALPYDFQPDTDRGGLFNELSNTQYYFYQDNIYMEMVGVTNMTGVPVTIQDGVVTTLIDLAGADVELTLPGGVRVGASEETVKAAFPEFVDRPLDGIAGFRGNELLYACNVRDDGCNGYVLIANDAPYFSSLSIICENGVIREICFETLGKERTEGVFR